MNSAIRASSLRRTQVERKDDSEQKMIDAAIRLIAKKGMEGLTLGAVGIEAGYSRGLPSHHFGTKAELIRAVARTIKNKNFKDLASVTEGALGLDGLKKTGRLLFRERQCWFRQQQNCHGIAMCFIAR